MLATIACIYLFIKIIFYCPSKINVYGCERGGGGCLRARVNESVCVGGRGGRGEGGGRTWQRDDLLVSIQMFSGTLRTTAITGIKTP